MRCLGSLSHSVWLVNSCFGVGMFITALDVMMNNVQSAGTVPSSSTAEANLRH